MADATQVGQIYLGIRADIKRLSKDLAEAQNEAKNGQEKIQRSINKINFDSVTRSVGGFMNVMSAIGSSYVFYKIASSIQDIGAEVLKVNASFETMKAKLNTLTRGQGEQTFDYLYKLVRDLPVGIETITQGFTTMLAMGLKPTTEQLITLTDVAAVLGQDVFQRVVLQLGQMTSKGKVMAQDLNILAEAGVNARKYILDAFGMTAEQIQDSGIEIQKVTDAIFKGMKEQFGGATSEMADKWQGLTAQLQKEWEVLAQTIGKAGIFDAAKTGISSLTSVIRSLNNALQMTGEEFEKWPLDKIDARLAELNRKYSNIFTPGGMEERKAYGYNEPADLEYRRLQAARLKALQASKAMDFGRGSVGYGPPEPQMYGALRVSQNEVNYNLKERWDAYLDGIKKAEEETKKMTDEQKKFSESYNKLMLSETDFERYQLDAKYREYEKYIGNKSALNDWYFKASMKIREKEITEEAGRMPEPASERFGRDRLQRQQEFDKATIEENDRMFVIMAERENLALTDKVKKWEDTHNQLTKLTERTAEAMQQNFSDLFFDFMTGKLKSFEDYAKAVFESIARAAADLMSQQLTRGLFGQNMQGGGWLSQLFGGGSMSVGGVGGTMTGSQIGASQLPVNTLPYQPFHSGGVVGASGGGMRAIPAAYYHSAPRYHSGLMPDEQPAILQKGETVLPKGTQAGGGDTYNVYNISAMDSESMVQALRRSGAVPLLAVESINNNSALRKTIMSRAR